MVRSRRSQGLVIGGLYATEVRPAEYSLGTAQSAYGTWKAFLAFFLDQELMLW